MGLRAQLTLACLALDIWRAGRQGQARLELRQERRLAALLKYARDRSPFYRQFYSQVPADCTTLNKFPPVTKRQLMGAFDGWVTDPKITRADVDFFIADPDRIGAFYRDDLFVCTSSGTTGHPGLFLHDQHALAVYRALVLVRIDLVWLTFWQWVQMGVRGLRWASVLGTGGHFAGAGWMELERRRSAWKQRAYRVLSVQRPLKEVVDELNDFDPTILSAYPSVLEQLAEEQLAGRLHLRPVLAEIAGESTSPAASSRMASAFGCEIHNAYGASEFPFFAFSCSHGWLHVSSDWVILEPVNEDLQPTPAGTPSHTTLLTNLANRIQPIIRYDLGDSVLVRPDACPCGSHLPAIRVSGRRDDVLRMITSERKAVAILPLAIGSVVEETAGVHRFQIIQAGPTSLRIRLAVQQDRNADVVWQTLVSNLRAYLAAQGLANVEVVRTNESPEQSPTSGKFRQVIGTSSGGVT